VIRYWYRLLNGTFKLWQLILLGLIWIAGGVTLQIVLRDIGGLGLAPGLVFYGSGAAHFWLAWKASREHRALDEMAANVEQREARIAQLDKKLEAAPREPVRRPPRPPRLGDDPFRDPPGPAPIVVVRPEPIVPRAAPAVDTTAGNSDGEAGPKILR
jgi:hypothetical protein